MHRVSANYTLPTVLNTLQPAINNGLRKALSTRASAAPTAPTTASSADGGLGTTFLNLLATELQNQDPTAPVDSTAMVGQMISLNQLDQLISINQTLTTTAGTGSPSPAPGAIGTAPDPANGGIPATLSPSTAAAAAAANQLPFDPNTMMPLNSGNANAIAASVNSSVNASLGSSSTNNNNSGGK